MKCLKCNQESEYDSPEEYCEFHWLLWWSGLDDISDKELSNEEKLKMFYDAIKDRIFECS